MADKKSNNTDNKNLTLLGIITAKIENLSNLQTVINKSNITKDSLAQLKGIIKSTLSICHFIVKNEKLLQQVSKIKLDYNKKNIDDSIGLIKLVIEDTSGLITALSKVSFAKLISINLTLNLTVVIIMRLVLKMIKLSKFMITLSPLHPFIMFGIKLINTELTELVKIYELINNVDVVNVLFKIPLISLSLNLVQTLMWRLARLQEDLTTIKLAIAGCMELAIGMKTINFLFDQIATTKTRFISWKLRAITSCITLIRLLLVKLTSLRVNPKLLLKIVLLDLILFELKKVFITIALIGLLAIPALLLMPVVYLAILGVVLLAKIISLIRISPRTLLSILMLSIVMTALLAVCVELVAISLLASQISFTSLLAFFEMLLAVTVLVALIGLAIASIAPLALFILAGLAFMFTIVTGLLLLAAELKLIEVLDLDGNKIKYSVSVIIDTALSIVDTLFSTISDKADKAKENDSVFSRFAKKILGGLGTLLEVILVIPVLLMSIVSVTLILFMAAVLRILQAIELNPDQIAANVNIVLNTAKGVINQLFHSDEEKITKDKSNDESWKRNVVDFMTGSLNGIGTVIDSIFAVATLAMTVISVSLILMIATELRILQTLELDTNKIYTNVTLVIDTARTIASRIIHGADDQENPKKENRTFVKDIISFFGDALGGLVTIVDSILAVGVLAMSILSVAILWGIASMLNKIQDIQLNRDILTEKVNTIINCANHVKSIVFHQEDKGSNDTSGGEKKSRISRGWDAVKGFSGAVVGTVKGFVDGIGNLGASAVLATSLVTIIELLRITKALNSIITINIQQEVIKNKVTDILNVAKFVSSSVTNSSVGTIDHDKVNSFEKFVSLVNKLVKSTNEIKSKKVRNLQDSILSVISSDSKITIDKNKVDSFHSYANDSIKLMKEINKLDTDKLIKYSDMWSKMTEFMTEIKNLNIEELSDAIVNKIAPAMSDISNNVGNINSKTEKQINTSPVRDTAPSAVAPTTRVEEKIKSSSQTDDLLQDIKTLLVDYFDSRM